MLPYRREITSTVHLISRQAIPLNLSRNLNGSNQHEQPFRTLPVHTLRALSLLPLLITTTAQGVLSGNLHRPRLTLVGIDALGANHSRHIVADLNE